MSSSRDVSQPLKRPQHAGTTNDDAVVVVEPRHQPAIADLPHQGHGLRREARIAVFRLVGKHVVDIGALFSVQQGSLRDHAPVELAAFEHDRQLGARSETDGRMRDLQQQADALHSCRRLRQGTEHSRRHLDPVDIDQRPLRNRGQDVAARQIGPQQQLMAGGDLFDQACALRIAELRERSPAHQELGLRLTDADLRFGLCRLGALQRLQRRVGGAIEPLQAGRLRRSRLGSGPRGIERARISHQLRRIEHSAEGVAAPR